MGCIPKSHIPVIAKKIFVKDNLANCNSLMYDCLERGGDGHVLTGHDKGVAVFESGCHGHIVCGCFSAAGIGNNRDSVVCSINAQCQRFISIRRDNASVFT